MCVHDRATRTKTRVNRLANNVFHYSHAQVFHISAFSFDLFHKYLGHPSLSMMNTLKGVSFGSNNVLHNCSVCLQPKQTHYDFNFLVILLLLIYLT